MNLHVDYTQFSRRLQEYAEKIRKSQIEAVNRTAFAVKRELKETIIPQQIDRPTPFTGNAYIVRTVSRGGSYAEIRPKDIQADYLLKAASSGTQTGSRPVPLDIAKNKYGNLPRNMTRRKNVFTGGGGKWIFRTQGRRRRIIIGKWMDRRQYSKTFDPKPAAERFAADRIERYFRDAMRRQ